MKTINKISLLLSSILFSQAVFANPYVTAEIGLNWYADNVYAGFFKNDDKGGLTGRLGVGYLWDLSYCIQAGLETGFTKYQDLNRSGVNYWWPTSWNTNYKRWDIDLLGVADFHVTEKFDIFAKLGVVYINQKMSINDMYHATDDFISPKAGIGIGYDISDKINVNLSVNQIYHVSSHHIDLDTTTALVGIKYNFG